VRLALHGAETPVPSAREGQSELALRAAHS
jgi:hypothetical protein